MAESQGQAGRTLPDRLIHVLIVEDNPVTAEFLKDRLSEVQGLRAEFTVRDRLAGALDVLDRGDVDLVFLDLLLPDSMGVDTFAKLDAHFPEVPKVVMSALPEDQVRSALKDAGAPWFLPKDGGGLERLSEAVIDALAEPWEGTRKKPAMPEADEEAMQREVMEAATDGIIVFAEDWGVRYRNRPARGLMDEAEALDLARVLAEHAEIEELFVKRRDDTDETGLLRVRLSRAQFAGARARVLNVRPVGTP